MTLPEFESLQATAQDIVAKADAGEFKGSPEMVEDARQFIANAPNLKEGIIARQPLSDIEEKIVFTPIFEGGEQVGVQQNTVKIRGNKIFDAKENIDNIFELRLSSKDLKLKRRQMNFLKDQDDFILK